MKRRKFIFYEPNEGTMTLGVVFHVDQEKSIKGWGYEPIGYVIEEEEPDEIPPDPAGNSR